MPRVEFETLPDEARVWVFAADRDLFGTDAAAMLGAVDAFLSEWKAHGTPLRCARDWRDGRFLAVGVDQGAAGASGCSIDGLFRVFKEGADVLGASLLNPGMTYWRDADGKVRSSRRIEVRQLVENGTISQASPVFDTTVQDAGAWRRAFERPAADTWVYRQPTPSR